MSFIVTVENIDGVIWNAEQKIAEIIYKYQRFGYVTIFLCNEGPDGNTLGLYKLLNDVCEQYAFDKKNITIQTGNLLEAHSDYTVQIASPDDATEYKHGQEISNSITLEPKQITKHFGIFIGRSNWKRLYLSAIIYSKYKDLALQTFHYNSASDYHKNHLGLEKLIHIKGTRVVRLVEPLLAVSPIIVDTILEYPIIKPTNYNIIRHYNKFFVEIVCETYSTGRTFFPTEKIWRPILTRTPFMVQGPIGFLANLKKLGFKTFNRWWDESYDEDSEQVALNTLERNIDDLSNKTTKQLQLMYNEMQEILDHNYKTFIAMNNTNFKFLTND